MHGCSGVLLPELQPCWRGWSSPHGADAALFPWAGWGREETAEADAKKRDNLSKSSL